MKNIGILLENMENVTLEGNQSSLIFHGKMMMFSTIGCKNIRIQNFDTDFQVPSVVSVTAEKVEGNTAIIDGVEKLTGARVSAPDLRAGAALVIAGMAADGITIVDDIVYIQRGYERFEEKLRSLGAVIERVSTET